METILMVTLSLLLAASSVIAFCKGIELNNPYLVLFGVGLFILFIVIFIPRNGCDKNKPTAIDVYRGKTTLQITYRDSIPVDSVVVFKGK